MGGAASNPRGGRENGSAWLCAECGISYLVAEDIETVQDVAAARDEAAAALLEVTKGSKAVVLEFEEPVGILEWLASRCPLRVQRRHKFSVGRADGTAVRVRDGREAD
jgi:hypothetical protein